MAKPVVAGDRFYAPTVTPARPFVRAGRTTVVQIRWKSIPVARKLRVSAMTTTSLTVRFLKPSRKAKVALRYAAGSRAPGTVRAGQAAKVEGPEATLVGLSSGREYSVSLFTKVSGEWVGPVSLTATTRAAGEGVTAAYITAPTTVLVPASAGVVSTPLPGGRMSTSLPAGVDPVLGRPLVLPGSAASPGGFIGVIESVDTAGKQVVLKQAALGTAFEYFKVNISHFGAPAAAARTRVNAMAEGLALEDHGLG